MGIRRRKVPLKDGSVTIRYTADAGRHPVTGSREGRRKDFERRADAASWLYDQTRPTPALGSMTVRELGEKFVQYKKLFRERSTCEKYEQHFRNHLNSLQIGDPQLAGVLLGDISIGNLQKRHLRLVREALMARLKTPAMLKKVWSTLAYALDYAVDLEELSANPVWSIKIEKISRRTPKQVQADEDGAADIPSEEDLATILTALDHVENDAPTLGQVFVSLEPRTGLRPSESRALTWPDMHLDGPFPYVEVTKRVDEYGVLGDVKTDNAHRQVPLPPDSVSMLKAWRKICPRNEVVEVTVGRRGTRSERRVLKNLNPRDLVFPTSNGTYQNPSNLHRRIWVPLQIALGLKDPVLTAAGLQKLDKTGKPQFKHRYRLYALRHVYASVKIKLGTSAKQLQMLMGHSSIQFTMDIYGHLWRDMAGDAQNAVAHDEYLTALKRRYPA